MELSLIHPCYNEEENIAYTVRESLQWFDKQGIDGEVIVVDDGSKDASPTILKELAAEDSRVKIVTHQVNQGYGLAVRSGCDAASKSYIAFMDSDGQFHVSDLALLIPYLTEYEFVPGRRRNRADPFVRNAFGKILGLLIYGTFGLWVRDVNCGLKAFSAEVWPVIRPLYGTEKFFNTELYLRLKNAGIPWRQVDVPHYPRRAGSPTGASFHVIFGMFRELWNLKRKLQQNPVTPEKARRVMQGEQVEEVKIS